MQELQGFSLNKCYNIILKQTNSREEHSLVIYRTVKIPPKRQGYYSLKGHVQKSSFHPSYSPMDVIINLPHKQVPMTTSTCTSSQS